LRSDRRVAGGPEELFIGAMKRLFLDALTEALKAIYRGQQGEKVIKPNQTIGQNAR